MAPRAQARKRLLEAAIRTLAAEGYGGTTARSIARTGGFAPGVIYYHFDDLEDLLLAALRHTSEIRMACYEEALGSCTDATELLARLRELYAEDMQHEGHIDAVQELFAASSASPRLRAELLAHVEPWADFAAAAIRRLVQGTAFEDMAPSREIGLMAVAMFLGIQTITHLDGDRDRIESLFTTMEPAAILWDAFARGGGTFPDK
ncbi:MULTISPECIES: TetR/AcrR family transcriptional regulator [Actinomadura]|uniref:TetR family transcriptional regulator n=1 Tax=Actinomadura litoris TaxID=2678616 RepID=A0A7K1LA03_9ACTN|nr:MULTISPECIES: TetR/AcrR family transcriptional regulator [Actinomadura]MBT2213347.1 TetR/AcrR family transcriptional regulator [Actinomadura sp. NEAU-AAG7]MUN41252.1 TetR family transcriptional regulator [Actinomadura litoris]